MMNMAELGEAYYLFSEVEKQIRSDEPVLEMAIQVQDGGIKLAMICMNQLTGLKIVMDRMEPTLCRQFIVYIFLSMIRELIDKEFNFSGK